jgi:hypothetical protein
MERSRVVVAAAVCVVVLMFMTLSIYLSRTLITSDDEAGYLSLGYLALRGEVSLYQQEIAGGRVPLPFYVIGLSQLPLGPDLWAGRLMSIVLGIGALLLTIRTGAAVAGPWAGVSAGLLLATQGAVVGYFATAGYHAFTALVLMAVVQPFIGSESNRRSVLGALATGLLFLTRTQVQPLVPYLVGVALFRARGITARVVVLAAGMLTPLVFLLSDRSHWKLLAHVPGLEPIAASLGYHSVFFFRGLPETAVDTQLWAIVLFGRRYESWTLAAVGLAVAFGWSWLRGRWRPQWPAAGLGFLAVLLAYCMLVLIVMFRANVKWMVAVFPTFAPLAAILLGAAFVSALTARGWDLVGRGLTVGSLVLALTISVVTVRNPLLPIPAGHLFHDDAVARLTRTVDEIRVIIPEGSRVFLLGHSLPLHLAGRLPYLQQVLTPWTFVEAHTEPWRILRSGFWGPDEMVSWLGYDAGYAVIEQTVLDRLRADRPATAVCLEALLEATFSRAARLSEYPWAIYDVYRRSTSAPAPPESCRRPPARGVVPAAEKQW